MNEEIVTLESHLRVFPRNRAFGPEDYRCPGSTTKLTVTSPRPGDNNKGFGMTMNTAFRHTTILLSTTLVLTACGGDMDNATGTSAAMDDAAAVSITVTNAGFATPESVLHDTTDDVYLVSNINGMPLGEDGNGFISRLSPDGEVLDLMWIDGADAGTTLNAPKGMAIDGDMLYVTDINCVRMFDRATGSPAGEHCLGGATFLNDLAPAIGGGVLFTDTGLDATFSPAGRDAVYRLNDGQLRTLLVNAQLGGPNGVLDTEEGPLIVTFGSGQVFRVSDGLKMVISGDSEGQLDGIVEMADGRILISSWGASCIYEMAPNGEMTCIIDDVEAPADIGTDVGRNRVLIPLFNADTVLIRTVP